MIPKKIPWTDAEEQSESQIRFPRNSIHRFSSCHLNERLKWNSNGVTSFTAHWNSHFWLKSYNKSEWISRLCLFSVMAAANQGNPDTAKSVYEFNVKDIKGNEVSMEKYRGNVLIIVNVASKCGYTAKHYAELNELYDQYADSKGEFMSRSSLSLCIKFLDNHWNLVKTERERIKFFLLQKPSFFTSVALAPFKSFHSLR